MKMPQYTKKDRWIMLGVLTPWVLLLNYLILGTPYFFNFGAFTVTTVITFSIMTLFWQVHTWIAVTLRERFPLEKDNFKRLLFAIFLFLLVTALVTSLLFWGYNQTYFLASTFNAESYRSAIIIGATVNVFVTFLHEGVLRFERWKAIIVETEQLKKEYMQSQLLGLKSQINPHFLFNSLNSLSSLINEDEQEAERFLDEMSKVYRYLLRNNEEELVSLHTELNFLRSYFYLLKVRHGRAIQLMVAVTERDNEKLIPPLTLQMLLENAINSNIGTKEQPIIVDVTSTEGAWLEIKNNVHRKSEDLSQPENLENITNKFRLLCGKEVEISEAEGLHVVRIPLIDHQMKVA